MLTRLAEIDDRQLYRREGYDSMFAYCVGDLHLSDDVAYKRIHAARAARQFPAVLIAVAEGRVHLRAVLMLARHLTSSNADELLGAATHKTRFEIQLLLAERFPQPDLPERLQAIPPFPSVAMALPPPLQAAQLAPEQVGVTISEQGAEVPFEAPPPEPARQLAPVGVEAPVSRSRVAPLSSQRFGFQFTVDLETHELWQYARALMSHEIPTGEMAMVLKGLLQLAVPELEQRKFATTARPGHARPSASARHIPAAVKRAVLERDGGRCTFVSARGHRCGSRTRLEFDHREPVARGGETSVENLRLLCRSHNQHAAESAFGAEFMDHKREEARAGQGRGDAQPSYGRSTSLRDWTSPGVAKRAM